MKPIVERCTELRTRLDLLGQAKDNEAKAQNLESRRNELEELRNKLVQVAASAQVLLNHKRLAASSLPNCIKALESCDNVQALLDEDPTAINKGRDYKYLLTRVGKVQTTLATVVEKNWRAVVAEHQGVDDSFLRRVEMFPGQAQTVEKIRRLKRAFDDATKQVPASEEGYQHFEACYSALQTETTKLVPESFPDDVLRFFRAAQQAHGAPLSLFSESVRDWLEKNGYLDGVRLRFTGEN